MVIGWSMVREVAAMVVKRRRYQCQLCRPIVCWAAASAELHCPSHSSIIVCCLVKISGWLQSQRKDKAAKNSFIGKTDADKTKENAKVSFQGKTPLLHARWVWGCCMYQIIFTNVQICVENPVADPKVLSKICVLCKADQICMEASLVLILQGFPLYPISTPTLTPPTLLDVGIVPIIFIAFIFASALWVNRWMYDSLAHKGESQVSTRHQAQVS